MTRAWKFAINAVIISLLGLQALASFGGLHRFRYWPFLSYPMYNRPHFKGEPVARHSLIGILDDGREIPITPADLKLDFWRYLRGPVRAFEKNEPHSLLAQLQPFEHRKRITIVWVRLENHPVTLVDGRVTDLPVESKTMALRPPS